MSKIEDWSLAYDLLRPLGHLVHRLAYRHLIVIGKENIPKNKPLIFAPNHQNALSDALSVITTSGKQAVYLGRADMFKNKLASKALAFFKINPVYRIRDGIETLDRNQQVFDECVRILKKKKTICIYPEAAHIGMKSMLPHKKAIPRITMLTAERTNFEIDVIVVPVGIYYSHYYNYKRDLVVRYGEPISSKSYYAMYKEHGEARAIQAFRKDIHDAICKLIVQVDDRKSYDLYDQGFDMVRSEIFEKSGYKNHPRYAVEAEQFFTKKLKEYFEKDDSNKDSLVKSAQRYKKLKERFKLSEEVLEKGQIGVFGILKNLIVFLLLLPFGLYAAVANGWLFYLTHYPHLKLVKDRHFYSTISFGLSFFIFPFWYIAQYFILNAFIHSWWISLSVLAFSIPSGIVAWYMGQLSLNTYKRLQIGRHKRQKTKTFQQLMSLRQELKDFYINSILA